MAKKLFFALNSLPDGCSGNQLVRDPNLSPNIKEVRISRIRTVGPRFAVSSFGWLRDPTCQAITKKLTKSYTCDYPLELLAHIETDLLPPQGVWKAAVDEAAQHRGDP